MLRRLNIFVVLFLFSCSSGLVQKRDGLWYDKSGVFTGSIVSHYDNGKIQYGRSYYRGKPVGKWHCWHDNGQMKSEISYWNGVKNGSFVQWYDNGQIEVEGNNNRCLDGRIIFYYRNGQVKQEGTYLNGQPDGKWCTWHENENLKVEGVFENGERVGWWSIYYDNGTLFDMYYYGNQIP